MPMPLIIVWFRQDLRLHDNPALYEASKVGRIIPIFIMDEYAPSKFRMGSASQCWLHHSLQQLNKSLKNKLLFLKGDALFVLKTLLASSKATEVYWNRCYEPYQIKRDTEIKSQLLAQGIIVKSFQASLLWEPWTILKKDKTPYKVFTPFFQKRCLTQIEPRPPFPKPSRLYIADRDERSISKKLNLCSLDEMNLQPKQTWHHSMMDHWKVGEDAAHNQLATFINSYLEGYKTQRDYPGLQHTSLLSPHLHFGEISPFQIWAELKALPKEHQHEDDEHHFKRELVWREFSYYLMFHFPQLPDQNLQTKFNQFPWKKRSKYLKLWQKGLTGFPIIDAGMRELWQTGYMHNRIRMIVASFLVKNLQIHWHCGRDWFWECLVDADLANNSCSWQWVAGCGVDAAPYFRIFNPVTQSQKFDLHGNYIKQYLPELANLPKEYIHEPWKTPPKLLEEYQITLGVTYPHPIVDLKSSRQAALDGYQKLKRVT